jgi:hypothetical protein
MGRRSRRGSAEPKPVWMPLLHFDRAPIVLLPHTPSTNPDALNRDTTAAPVVSRVADFIPASSDVKGVFAARRESLSIL